MHIWICLLCKLFSHSSKLKFQQLKFQYQEKKTKGKGLGQIYLPKKVSNLLLTRRLNMLVS